MLTVWQVYVDGWKYTTPEIAAFVCDARPGAIRLTEVAEPTALRFRRWPRHPGHVNGVNPQRLSAARKALAKEREKAGLFCHLVAATQPTAEQRIATTDLGIETRFREERFDRARCWKDARAKLRGIPEPNHCSVIFAWNMSSCPADPAYLLNHIKSSEVGRNRPAPGADRGRP
jgi:hypothetical protein